MKLNVNMRDINHRFTHYINEVQEGNEIIVIRRGQPVARIVPFNKSNKLSSEQKAALKRTLKRMTTGYHLGGHFDRDSLYKAP